VTNNRPWLAIVLSGITVAWMAIAETTAAPPSSPASSQVVTVGQLPALARAAKGAFRAPTQADLDAAWARVRSAAAALDARFKAESDEAKPWREYLMWDKLREQLADSEGPKLKVLEEIHGRFASGHEGLELVWFDAVRKALERYFVLAQAVRDPDVSEQYQRLLDDLAEYLESYQRDPSPENASAIRTALEWLQSAGQAPALVEAIRAHHAKPNVFVQASAELIAAIIVRPVNEIQPVSDCILGTAIFGSGLAQGQAIAELVPNAERAQVELVINGTVHSNSVGYNRSVQIYSDGVTWLDTRKPIYLEPERIWAAPSYSRARTSTTTKDIDAPHKIVERIAWRRVQKQLPQAEAIASDHAAQRASSSADERSDQEIADLDDRYQKRFRKRLMERGIYPQLLRYSTTRQALCAMGLEADAADLAATTAPPTVAQPLDLTVQLHQSLVNNMAEELLAGAILTPERLQNLSNELLGEVPERLKPDPNKEPWRIHFIDRQPLSVTFEDGRFRVVVRGRFTRTLDRMNITAVYRIEETPEGVKAVREEDLDASPPGFKRGSGRQLSARQVSLRRQLVERFSELFEPEIAMRDIELRTEQGIAGKLRLARWEVSPGWTALSWRRLPPDPAAPTPATDRNRAADASL